MCARPGAPRRGGDDGVGPPTDRKEINAMLKRGAHADQQLAALWGERDGAVAADEKRGVKQRLELAHALGDELV